MIYEGTTPFFFFTNLPQATTVKPAWSLGWAHGPLSLDPFLVGERIKF
ncbi:unnamed protein product, partial [Vitis vinifera]